MGKLDGESRALSKYVLKKAKASNICEPWADKIEGAESVDDLLQMYVAGIDFCLANNFPSNADLLELGGDVINQYGIYIDAAPKLVDRPFVVALGACNLSLSIADASASQVFVKHESKATITASGDAFIVIDCFDNSITDVIARDNARVLINVYGDALVTHSGPVKIINKLKQTY